MSREGLSSQHYAPGQGSAEPLHHPVIAQRASESVGKAGGGCLITAHHRPAAGTRWSRFLGVIYQSLKGKLSAGRGEESVYFGGGAVSAFSAAAGEASSLRAGRSAHKMAAPALPSGRPTALAGALLTPDLSQ